VELLKEVFLRKVIEETLEEAANRNGITYNLQWRGFQAEGCVMDEQHPSIQVTTIQGDV